MHVAKLQIHEWKQPVGVLGKSHLWYCRGANKTTGDVRRVPCFLQMGSII